MNLRRVMPKGSGWAAALLLVAGALAPHAAAGDPASPQQPQEIVVKSKRLSPPRSATPATVLSRADIARSNARTAADALQHVPGLLVDGPQNQRDGNAHVRIRGFDARYTLVLIDGRRVTTKDADGTADLSTLPVEAIEKIEVIKGPMAVLLGGDAIGGVVQITTRGGVAEDKLEASVTAGSFATWGAGLRADHRFGAVDVRLRGRFESSEGYSDAWDLDRTLRQITAKTDARGTQKTFLDGETTWNGRAHRWTLGGRLGRTDAYKHKLSQKFTESGAREGQETAWQGAANADWTWRPRKGVSLESTAWLDTHDSERIEQADLNLAKAGRAIGSLQTDERDAIADRVLGWRSRAIWRGESWQLAMTTEARRRDRDAENQRVELHRDVDRILIQHADFRKPEKIYAKDETVAASGLQGQIGPWHGLSALAGARLDWHDVYGAFFGPTAGLTAQPFEALKLHYGIGRGHKMPSLESRTRSPVPDLDTIAGVWRAGNAELRPESALAQELGLAIRLPLSATPDADDGLVTLAVTAFRTRFRDKIQKVISEDFAGTGLPLEREVNLASALSQGFESALAWTAPGARWRLGLQHTWLNTAIEPSGGPMDRTPEHVFSVLATVPMPWSGGQMHWTCKALSTAAKVDAQGRIDPLAGSAPLRQCDVRLDQALGSHLSATLDVANLWNAQWDKDGDGDSDLAPLNAMLTLKGRL